MTDTPRTDAAYETVRAFTNEEQAVDALVEMRETSRKLERENAALRGLLQDSLEWLDDYGLRMSGTSNLVSRIETVLRKEAQP